MTQNPPLSNYDRLTGPVATLGALSAFWLCTGGACALARPHLPGWLSVLIALLGAGLPAALAAHRWCRLLGYWCDGRLAPARGAHELAVFCAYTAVVCAWLATAIGVVSLLVLTGG